MPTPTRTTPLGRFATALLAGERYLRDHPAVIAILTIGSFVAIGAGHQRFGIELPLAVTFAGMLAFCTYSIGALAGATAAMAIAVIWLADALALGVPLNQALPVFGMRLFSNFAIVAVSAVAAMAARTRENYLDAQQQLVRLRADLVSAFSHDLRAPLTAIMGYADMLREGSCGTVSPMMADVLERILANVHHLDQLIGDMLTAGQGEGAAPIQISTFEAEELVMALRREFDERPHRGEVSLVWHVAPHTPPLRTDRVKLTSIVRNLVGNSLKFTSDGSVVVRLGYDHDAAMHRVEVEDTGPGIPPEAVPHVFDRFYRATRSHQSAGFGLGLFIVKRFTELLGGSVTVLSQVGRGTCFTVTLPRREAHIAAPVAATP